MRSDRTGIFAAVDRSSCPILLRVQHYIMQMIGVSLACALAGWTSVPQKAWTRWPPAIARARPASLERSRHRSFKERAKETFGKIVQNLL
jgi:hypothetical protein